MQQRYTWEHNPLAISEPSQAQRVGWRVADELCRHAGFADGFRGRLMPAAVLTLMARANARGVIDPPLEPYDLARVALDDTLRRRLAEGDPDEYVHSYFSAPHGTFEALSPEGRMEMLMPCLDALSG